MGSAVREAFKASDKHFDILGLAHSRSGEGLVKLDLTDNAAVEKVFREFKPNCTQSKPSTPQYVEIPADYVDISGVIHCAAERRPDVAEKVRYLVSVSVKAFELLNNPLTTVFDLIGS